LRVDDARVKVARQAAGHGSTRRRELPSIELGAGEIVTADRHGARAGIDADMAQVEAAVRRRRVHGAAVSGTSAGIGPSAWIMSPPAVWSGTDRPARMIVEYATTERPADARGVVGPAALPETGHATEVVLTGLPAGQDVFYRVTFQDLAISSPRACR
jgi:alkaline phosphatase D